MFFILLIYNLYDEAAPFRAKHYHDCSQGRDFYHRDGGDGGDGQSKIFK